LGGAEGRPPRIITSIYLQPEVLERHNLALQAKLAAIAEREQRSSGMYLEDADLIVVAFGSAARVAQNAVEAARARGMAVGLFRPITLSPFPTRRLARLAPRARAFLVVEMNAGQMIEDVRLAVGERAPVRFCGRMGGVEMLPDEVLQAIEQTMHDTRVTKNGARILDAEVRL
jgi:2-oxoglutarate ferredoxin oxidoreductase subunit alpha